MNYVKDFDTFVLEADGEAYKKYFKKKLKNYGVESPAELDKATRAKFFSEIKKEWKG